MERGYILSIDQSTQGTKAILLDGQGQFVLRRDLPHRHALQEHMGHAGRLRRRCGHGAGLRSTRRS